jgi:hypothetical protein
VEGQHIQSELYILAKVILSKYSSGFMNSGYKHSTNCWNRIQFQKQINFKIPIVLYIDEDASTMV